MHSRPHTSGHQLHFDSDETGLMQGGSAVHPIVSCVMYLTDDAGGPTLITDQTLVSGLAEQGWLSSPQTNRLLAFDARFLHGAVRLYYFKY